MARLSRLVIPHQVHHVVQRATDAKIIFADVDDYTKFLSVLSQACKQFQIALHAYVVMPEHFHLLVTPPDEASLGKMMQWVGRQYVPYFNAKYQRSGSLWQGRFKATVIEAQTYFLAACVYLETHVLRTSDMAFAGSVAGQVMNNPWSSAPHHCGMKIDPLISDHELYWKLGNTPFQREAAYKELLHAGVSSSIAGQLTESVLKGWILGSAGFSEQMATQTQRRVAPVKRGRPAKAI